MKADCFFTIGKTHDVCEDYAYVECVTDAAIGIVSDGCSGSPHTDFGSRFLVRAAAERLWEGVTRKIEFDHMRTIYQAYSTTKQISGLLEDCLDATLICAKVIKQEDGYIGKIWIQGDGLIVRRLRSNAGYIINEITYDSGMPAYLSYLLSHNRLGNYMQRTAGIPIVLTTTKYCADWSICEDVEIEPCPPFHFSSTSFILRNLFDQVLLFSDGVHSFQRRDQKTKEVSPVPALDVVKEIMKYSGTGDFLKRRCKSFFKRFCKDNGWENNDDFSVVAIDFTEP